MRIYVGNLSRQITDTQLHDLALLFGKPESAHVARALLDGESKGFGFVVYTSAEEARAAIAGLNGKNLDEQVLWASEANPLRALDADALAPA